MDTDICFIIFIKINDIYKDIRKDFETRCSAPNCESDQLLPNGKNRNVIDLMKDELDRQIMKEFVRLGAETYSNLVDDGSEDKKGKGAKKCVIRRKFNFEDYEHCLEATQPENKIKHLQKNKIFIDNLKENPYEFINNNRLI